MTILTPEQADILKYLIPICGAVAAVAIAAFPFVIPSERMRRSVKRHIEVYQGLPDGIQKDRLGREIASLTSRWLDYKSYMKERQNNYLEWGMVLLSFIYMPILFLSLFRPIDVLPGYPWNLILFVINLANILGVVNLFRGRTWIGSVPNASIVAAFRSKRCARRRRSLKIIRLHKKLVKVTFGLLKAEVQIAYLKLENKCLRYYRWLIYEEAIRSLAREEAKRDHASNSSQRL